LWIAGILLVLSLVLGLASVVFAAVDSSISCLLGLSLCFTLPATLISGIVAWARRRKVSPFRKAPARGGRTADPISRWWKGLSANEVQVSDRYGDIGEIEFFHYLEANLPDTYLGLRGLQVARSLDVDVLVIGPTGIWVFESKYWRGRISVRQGVWKREESHWEAGGREVETESEIEAFDQQWLRERDQVQKTLQVRLPRYSWLPGLVQGGIVFTHPEIELDVDRSCQAELGGQAYWLKRILSAPVRRELTLELRLEVLDAFLNYADHLQPGARRSALDLANKVSLSK
jgi:hypothetical protein